MPKDLKRLRQYVESLRKKKDEFPCPECGLSLLPKAYEKHCSSQHDFNAKRGCAWCRKVFWKGGTKCDHADHLLACFRAVLALSVVIIGPSSSNAPPSRAPPSSPRLLDMRPMFPARSYFGIRHELPPRAHEHPRLLEVSHKRIFEDDSLHLASSYVRHFVETQATLRWFHVMVRSVAYESFLDVLQREPACRVLPFSCWCDGGPHATARYRQHRHLIVVAPRGHFEHRVWPRVKAADKPRKNFPCKRMKGIDSPLHLANTLGYVSHRRSRCNFSFKVSKKVPNRDKHFHLYQCLPRDFLLPLCLLWVGGHQAYLYQKYFQNASVEKIVGKPMVFREGKWHQKLKDFPSLERGLVVPVSKDLAPGFEERTDRVLHLMDGRKLYLRHVPEFSRMEPSEWLRRQAEGGNCLHDAAGEAWWIPRPRIRKELNFVKPLVDRVARLETQSRVAKRKFRVLETEIQELRSENTRMKNKMERLESEDEGLKIENAQMKRKMKTLESEIQQLKYAKRRRCSE